MNEQLINDAMQMVSYAITQALPDAAVQRARDVIGREATYNHKNNRTEPELEKTINTYVAEYVKGTKNMYAHPAVAEYNKTTDSSNKTVSTLMRIIRGFGSGSKKQTINDPLADIMNGADDE